MTIETRLQRPLPLALIAVTALVSLLATHQHAQANELLPSKALPGGEYSVKRITSKHALNRKNKALDLMSGLDFKVGEAIFEKIWVFAPSSTQASDGLGPLYNARSCNRCHTNNSRGLVESVLNPNDRNISLFTRLSIPPSNPSEEQSIKSHQQAFIPEPNYGAQFQNFAYPGGKAEGHLNVTYTPEQIQLNGGEIVTLYRPAYEMTELGYGPFHKDVMISPRIAPPIHGLGLLEAISDSDIKSLADPDDRNQDKISGRVRYTLSRETGEVELGRFGWKAGAPSVNQQNTAALSGDIGIGSAIYPSPYGDCTPKQTACLDQAHGNTASQDGLEASLKMTNALLHYVRNISVPQRPVATIKANQKGEQLFNDIGCAACHTPSFKTREDYELKHLAGQTIWPYTDLLLHDMGPGLADNRPEGNASGTEWRTPPLWGIGLTKAVLGVEFYLHDGRARSLQEAILWHDGEARSSKDHFKQLSPPQRQSLINFLKSL